MTQTECQEYMQKKADKIERVFCSVYTCHSLKMDAINYILDDLVNDCHLMFRK